MEMWAIEALGCRTKMTQIETEQRLLESGVRAFPIISVCILYEAGHSSEFREGNFKTVEHPSFGITIFSCCEQRSGAQSLVLLK